MNSTTGLKKMRFEKDPYYLYPLKDEMIISHFVDRDEEIKTVKGVLKTQFEDTIEISAVIGGIGIGKSSMLNLIGKMAADMGYSVVSLESPDAYASHPKSSRSKMEILLIDDVDKIDDDHACTFYTNVGKNPTKGRMIFFTDTYDRNIAALNLRNHTISHNISLPQRLDRDRLRFFLEARMRNCLAKGSKYAFPFADDALEMASIRSRGNLRNFLNYSRQGWMVAIGGDRTTVGQAELRTGMVSIDRALLGGCDAIDMRILWFSTEGDMNKAFLAHQCGIDTKTIDGRIKERLMDFVETRKSGKDVLISSIYKNMTGGKEVLTEIIRGLGFHMPEITGQRE